jgi:hypothetical protein
MAAFGIISDIDGRCANFVLLYRPFDNPVFPKWYKHFRKDGQGNEIHRNTTIMRPLKNVPFCPISVSPLGGLSLRYGSSDFNPRNTTCIPVVKIFVFLELEQN